ncbi:hypothetical protein Mal15_35390 [Stieleria maiorica]|uniref:Sulfotransferase n=1 Tax=Stieleria maiorica TaxID=2795974 RepID=A0A5B9MIJ2_9BACT|nr:hypothetical protein [Stieleria maiorica]QEF99474.1 hypothetical protein Mal15_35390 [Stieleria maiorica]
MHPIVLTVSTGRCGTTFLEKSFRNSFANRDNWVTHEHLKQQITRVGKYHRCYDPTSRSDMVNAEIRSLLTHWKSVAKSGPVVDFGWTMRSLVPYFYEQLANQLRVLYVHRHPIEVAASFKLIGNYSIYNSEDWAIIPRHPNALYPQFAARWDSMTPFEKCLYYWLEVNAAAQELKQVYPELNVLEVKSSDLFRSEDVLQSIVEFTGFDCYNRPVDKSRERNRREIFLLERRPIGQEWIRYQEHPEIIEFAQRLGYDMSKEFVESLIPKYQLPPGVVPWLRNRSGYWALKESVGKTLRKVGLR